VVRRRQRREVRAACRPVPGRDGLPKGEQDAGDNAEHSDGGHAPDGGGAAVGVPGSDNRASARENPSLPRHVPAPTISSADATASSRTSKGSPFSTGGSATTTTRT
jgi:hypothetical protein